MEVNRSNPYRDNRSKITHYILFNFHRNLFKGPSLPKTKAYDKRYTLDHYYAIAKTLSILLYHYLLIA